MRHSTFTTEMQECATKLVECGADVQRSGCFGMIFSQPERLTSPKMAFMLKHGLDMDAVISISLVPRTTATGLNALTHGIPLDEFIEIMTIIQNHLG